MKMLRFVYFGCLFGVLGWTRSVDVFALDTDPAPGRSPGPPETWNVNYHNSRNARASSVQLHVNHNSTPARTGARALPALPVDRGAAISVDARNYSFNGVSGKKRLVGHDKTPDEYSQLGTRFSSTLSANGGQRRMSKLLTRENANGNAFATNWSNESKDDRRWRKENKSTRPINFKRIGRPIRHFQRLARDSRTNWSYLNSGLMDDDVEDDDDDVRFVNLFCGATESELQGWRDTFLNGLNDVVVPLPPQDNRRITDTLSPEEHYKVGQGMGTSYRYPPADSTASRASSSSTTDSESIRLKAPSHRFQKVPVPTVSSAKPPPAEGPPPPSTPITDSSATEETTTEQQKQLMAWWRLRAAETAEVPLVFRPSSSSSSLGNGTVVANGQTSNELPLQFDVTHDSVEPRAGLVAGVEYTVVVNCSAAVRNFYIEASLGTFLNAQKPVNAAHRRPLFPLPMDRLYGESGAQISKEDGLKGRVRMKRRSTNSSVKGPIVEDNPDSDKSSESVDNRRGSMIMEPSMSANLGEKKMRWWRTESRPSAHLGDNTNESSSSSRDGGLLDADNGIDIRNFIAVDGVRGGEVVSGGGGGRRTKRESARKDGASTTAPPTNCRNKNVWIENFVYSPAFTVKWRFSENDLQQINQTTMVISFRILYRVDESDPTRANFVYEKTFSYSAMTGCQLTLRDYSGQLDSQVLPGAHPNCTIRFPGAVGKGLLVQLKRLNVPCSSGHLQFTANDRSLRQPVVCGKLEELPTDSRTLYFRGTSAALSVINRPVFTIAYRLVDACYNTTLTDASRSIRLRTGSAEPLECYFRIHLPYGYRIRINIVTNFRDSHVTKHRRRRSSAFGNSGSGGVGLKSSRSGSSGSRTSGSVSKNSGLNSAKSANYVYNSEMNMGAPRGLWAEFGDDNYDDDGTAATHEVMKGEGADSTRYQTSDTFMPITSDLHFNYVDNEQSNWRTAEERQSDGGGANNRPLELIDAQVVADYATDCGPAGLSVLLWDGEAVKWSQCYDQFSNSQRISFLSSSNVLSIKVLRRADMSMAAADAEPRTRNVDNGVGSERSGLPSLLIEYSAERIDAIVSQCAFGWIAFQHFCIAAMYNKGPLSWQLAETECQRQGGHLLSIRSRVQQRLIDQYLRRSPGPGNDVGAAYWIGATDNSYEGEFHWTDSLPFSYTNWFPGWEQFEYYNRQPNDDGLSDQDCVEIRRHYRYPPAVTMAMQKIGSSSMFAKSSKHSESGGGGESSAKLLNSFMWNDRDCNAKNHFICERPMDEMDEVMGGGGGEGGDANGDADNDDVEPSRRGPAKPNFNKWMMDCNKTIHLTRDRTKISVSSPGFPHPYPANIHCFTVITAPPNHRIIVDFEELVLENEPQCTYDFLEISESEQSQIDFQNLSQGQASSPPSAGAAGLAWYQVVHKVFNRSSTSAPATVFNPDLITAQLLNSDGMLRPQMTAAASERASEAINRIAAAVPRKLCGDWSPKLKLLRYVTKLPLLLFQFASDYSHQNAGYKAKVYIENVSSECGDERLKLHNENCYLFNMYPPIDWWTAQQVCRSIGAQLASVASMEELRFITGSILTDINYTSKDVYWLGGELNAKTGHYEWSDGSAMNFQDKIRSMQNNGNEIGGSSSPKTPLCLGLQRKASLSPGLNWAVRYCSVLGGYVCKRPKETAHQSVVQNQTVVGSEGRLTSPAYPNAYPPNVDYSVKISGPERSRLIVQFQKLDLEYQDECMYDYVSVRDYKPAMAAAVVGERKIDPGTYPIPLAMFRADDDVGVEGLRPHLNRDYYSNGPSSAYRTERNLEHQVRLLSTTNDLIQESIKGGGSRKKRYMMSYAAGRMQRPASSAASFQPYVRWCGQFDANMSRFDFISKSNQALLHFHSDYSGGGAGFSAIWTAVDITGCPMQTITSREGVIHSPNHPYFLLNHLDCTYVIQAPLGRKVWIEFIDYDIRDEAQVWVDLGGNEKIQPFAHDRVHTEGSYMSAAEKLWISLKTGAHPEGRGFKVAFRTVAVPIVEQKTIALSNNSNGFLHHLNYPREMPENVDFVQHLVVPLGEVISLELHGVVLSANNCKGGRAARTNDGNVNEDNEYDDDDDADDDDDVGSNGARERVTSPDNSPGNGADNLLEIYDNYADVNGTKWILCAKRDHHGNRLPAAAAAVSSRTARARGQRHDYAGGPMWSDDDDGGNRDRVADNGDYSPVFITSYLNTLHIRQKSAAGRGGGAAGRVLLNATLKVYEDKGYKPKLASKDIWVESCQPNPCQYGGKCIETKEMKKCECLGHYSGRFCGLTICDFDPCLFGTCELTATSFKCNCLPGYRGDTCEQKRRPCAENPCQGRGECFEKNNGFYCRCHAWWEGPRCERKMINIPYKPLSERMLQEPFWLGLITVFVVLAIIGLVWCAKRHFPEKIEKLLAEEADRNRPGSAHSHHTSLREQLQFTTPIPQQSASNSNATILGSNGSGVGGAPGGHKGSIFGRLGIRKPSILSLSSPQPTGGAAARSPSPRKKRNNSTPSRKNTVEKKQILQQLISPGVQQPQQQQSARPKLSLGEIIQMTDNNHLKPPSVAEPIQPDEKETSFFETTSLTSSQTALSVPDPKLEKKVTFARLLSRVSAEISSGSDHEVGNGHAASAFNLSVELPIRASSVPPSPVTNDIRSPHSTSSNQGSDSLSGSDFTLPDFGKHRRNRLKVSSADSILAMFRNYTSTTQSFIISPTNTPTVSSPQEELVNDDEDSTSSMHTPHSFSSAAPDSPVYYRQATIEVPVLDPLSAHKAATPPNHLHPPTILLEIPSCNNAMNKCLSPIREMPTPMPSPALTPIMPRPQRTRSPSPQMCGSGSDEENNSRIENAIFHAAQQIGSQDSARTDSEVENLSIDTPTAHYSPKQRRNKFQMRTPAIAISIDVEPPSPPPSDTESRTSKHRDIIIPKLIIEQPSPTKSPPHYSPNFPGSPPPQRASIGETSFLFPNKQQQKRLLKQLEKPTSLDLQFTPPIIMVTANLSEAESDLESMSPAIPKPSANNLLGVPGPSGMCYLSPFSIVSRNERTTSESNLSSSGYSSMASPGPSRCGSSNPLCSSEAEDPSNGHPHGYPGSLLMRRHSHNLKLHPSVSPTGGGGSGGASNCPSTMTTMSAAAGNRERLERMRNRSDSETLSDEPILESNDEGIGTDHIDEKIEDGEIRSAKELQLYMGSELIETGKNILAAEQPGDPPTATTATSTSSLAATVATGVGAATAATTTTTTVTMAQLQLPSIVIQSENGDRALSPVSSRSESPISERTTGMGRFSPLFYGKKDQQLPFTDSDGLYDFPSSDGKGNYLLVHNRKTTSGKRKERKSSKSGPSTSSPNRGGAQLDVPGKEPHAHRPHSPPKHSGSRKSPKRRPVQRHNIASSSSSTESLVPSKEQQAGRSNKYYGASPTKTTCITYSNENTRITCDSGEEIEELPLCQPLRDEGTTGLPKRLHRLRAIGNQIRFLRRLQKSIQRRVHGTDSEEMDLSEVTSPLLAKSPSLPIRMQKSQPYKLNRQSRIAPYHSLEVATLRGSSLPSVDLE